MKSRYNFLIIIVCYALIINACIRDNTKEVKNNKKEKNAWIGVNYNDCNDKINNCVVIELFSSESCYDCPSSELAFNQIVSQQIKYKDNVILLASHVDYWNDLVDGEGNCEGNWVDKFSNGTFTTRQFAYARKLKMRPGTPQIFINGKEFISDPGTAIMKEKIKQYLEYDSYYQLCLFLNKEKTEFTNQALMVDFEIEFIDSINHNEINTISPQLMIYLVERNIESKPDKGENCGKVLYHDNIVRAFASKTIRGAYSGNVKIDYPVDVKLENCSVLGFIQDLYSLEIIGGTNGFYFANEE